MLYPDVMLAAEVAEAMRVSVKHIYARLEAGTFLPLPFDRRPYRWRGEDIEAWRRGDFQDAIERLRMKASNRRR
jgi:hypothetical protein